MINRIIPLLFHQAYETDINFLLNQLREIEENRFFLKEFKYKNYLIVPNKIQKNYCNLIYEALNNNANFLFIDPNISNGVLHTILIALENITFDKKNIFCIDLPDIEFKFEDYYFLYESIKNQLKINNKKEFFKAIIPVFKSKSLDYSYIYEKDFLIHANEKQDGSSEHASTGFYIFSSVNIFKNLAEKSILGKSHFNNKFYISPIFNKLSNKLGLFKIMQCKLIKRHK
tara:strand:- start:44 stop:730 length:687 start_codon:yes stop_codon:yes gene_type:complete